MSKQVRETAAGKSISAYVVLNKRGDHVATVQAHYSDGGTVTVDVWNQGDAATQRTAVAMGYRIDPESGRTLNKDGTPGAYPYKVAGLQHGRAGGGGYDKFSAALSGLFIDGHYMTDHCGKSGAPKPPRGRSTWPDKAKAPRGYTFNNFQTSIHCDGERIELAPDSPAYGWASCFRLGGFKYLEAFGYRVIQAI